MGGCASKPKDLDFSAAPTENSTSPRKPEPEPQAEVKAEVVPQENEDVGETKKEEPLIDISEPAKEEAAKSVETLPESKTITTTTTTTEVEPLKPTEEAKPVVEEAAAKEEPKKEVAAANVDAAAAAAAKVPEQEKITSPKAQDKSDAPLVTV